MQTDAYTEWYNENEGRSYPLDEGVTQKDDSGKLLPTNILCDLSVVVPPTHQNVRLSSLRITPRLITVAISSDTSGLLVGTFSRDGIDPYRAYPLTPLIVNVSGWVTFGNHRTVTVEDFRFTDASQSRLAVKVVRYVAAPLVTDLVRVGGNTAQAATGIVKLIGDGVTIERDPEDQQRIIFKLDSTMRYRLAGPCNQPAGTDTCGVPQIRRINGVTADETGTITLRFE